MDETVFTYLKGVAFLLAVFFLCYPVVLVVQLLTGTVTESVGQIAVLLVLSALAWAWAIHLYQNAEFPPVGMTTSDGREDG